MREHLFDGVEVIPPEVPVDGPGLDAGVINDLAILRLRVNILQL